MGFQTARPTGTRTRTVPLSSGSTPPVDRQLTTKPWNQTRSNFYLFRQLTEERHSEEYDYDSSYEDSRREPQLPPLDEETDLGVDFCLTWSADPRLHIYQHPL